MAGLLLPKSQILFKLSRYTESGKCLYRYLNDLIFPQRSLDCLHSASGSVKVKAVLCCLPVLISLPVLLPQRVPSIKTGWTIYIALHTQKKLKKFLWSSSNFEQLLLNSQKLFEFWPLWMSTHAGTAIPNLFWLLPLTPARISFPWPNIPIQM